MFFGITTKLFLLFLLFFNYLKTTYTWEKIFNNATFYNSKNLHHDRLRDAFFTYFSCFYTLGCHWVWTCSNISVGTFEKRRIKRPWNLHGYSLHRHLQMCWPQDCFVWCATTGGEYSFIVLYLFLSDDMKLLIMLLESLVQYEYKDLISNGLHMIRMIE